MRVPSIESHLREKLPVVYPTFSDNWAPITSASVTSNEMKLTVANTLSVGDKIVLNGIIYKNDIASVILNLPENKAIIETAEVNEFTQDFKDSLTISGATEPEWNGTFEIITCIDRYKLEIKISSSITGVPTGSPVVEEVDLPRYNNLFEVTIADPADFSVETVNAPDGALFGSPEFIELNTVCVSSDVDFERVLTAYTKQKIDKVWIFIVAGATGSSRSRENDTDFDQTYQVGEDRIIHTQENLSVFAFYPTFLNVSAVQAQDLARNELKNALISLMVGFVPESTLCAPSNMIYYIADGVETYNASYYVHRYDFAANVDITPDDTYVDDSYAIRKITSNYINEDTGNQIASDLIDFTEVD